MIGHFLGTLTTEQEDRVLTTKMLPGDYNNQCLVGCALTPIRAFASAGNTAGGLRFWGINRDSVEEQFDMLCARFGAPRMNAAIRNRILANRAYHALTGVSREAVVQ